MFTSSRPGWALLAAGIFFSFGLSACSTSSETAGAGESTGTSTGAQDSSQGSTSKGDAQGNDYVLKIAQRLSTEPWGNHFIDPSLGFEYSVVDLPGEPYSLLVERAFLEQYNGVAKFVVLDPKKKEMVSQYKDLLGLGIASAGGFRGRMHPSADGTQLLYVTTSSGTGDTEVQRVTAPDGHLQISKVAEGQWDDLESMWGEEIQWKVLPSVERAGRKPHPTLADSARSQSGAPAPSENHEQPAEGTAVQLSGTIRTLSSEEILDLQNEIDPNPWIGSEQFTVLLLDSPVELGGHAVSHPGLTYRQATMISLRDIPGLSQYEGKHVTMEIDPFETWWPSDTSLPLREPRTSKAKVIS